MHSMEKKIYITPESSVIEVALEAALLTESDIQSFELYDYTTEEQI